MIVPTLEKGIFPIFFLRDNCFFESPPGQPKRDSSKNHEPEISREDIRLGILVMLSESNEVRANGKIPYAGNQQRHGIIHREYF